MAASQTLSRTIDRELFYSDELRIEGVKNIAFQSSVLGSILFGENPDPDANSRVSAGMMKRTQDGGQKVQVDHIVEQNSTVQSMASGWSSYDTTPQDFGRRSEANWKHYSGTRTISLTDTLINKGTAARSKLVDAETMNVFATMVELVTRDAISGSASSELTGFDSVISANDTVQGLSGASFGNWNSRGVSARGTAAGSVSFASGSFAGQGIADMRSAYTNATEGGRQPSILGMTYDIWNFYEAQLTNQQRYGADDKMGNASFGSLMFRNARCYGDPFVTSGEILFLNPDVLFVVVLEGADFAFQPWKDATNQESKSSELVFKGQVICTDRRLVNKLTGVTA
jgi:hypothetical protein